VPGTILLLDTFSLLFRAHHALPPMSTVAGEPTAAVYGLSTLLLKLLRERRPSAIAFALDTKGPTFRHARYPAYKAGRMHAPVELRAQHDRLAEIIAALGAPSHRAAGYEADDVLATLARTAVAAGDRALVVSGDRDLLQVVRGGTEVLFVGRRGAEPVVYDEAAVVRRFGVRPQALPSFVALVGDPSDNVPKVPGIGPRTASLLVERHGDIAGIFAGERELPPKLRGLVEGRREELLEREDLLRLRTDVPLEPPLHVAVHAAALARLRPVFEALEFKSLLPRLDAACAAIEA
jgi:DNA polymerase-1